MAENDTPERDDKIDPSEQPGEVAPASAHAPGAPGGGDEGACAEKKDKPGSTGKGINPVQHSE